jgi:hypothetical protein
LAKDCGLLPDLPLAGQQAGGKSIGLNENSADFDLNVDRDAGRSASAIS